MTILSLDTKACMAHLLLKETFDSFSFIEGEITTFNKFSVNGRLHNNFFDVSQEHEYSSWGDVREYCFSVIKGKRTPLDFKFILSLPMEDFPSFLEKNELNYNPSEIQGLYLNLRFDGTHLQCVTGTSMNTFTMDKSVDFSWDAYVKTLFSNHQIAWEEKTGE